MKKICITLSAVFALFLTSCEELNGYITAHSALIMKTRSGDKVTLPAGSVTNMQIKIAGEQKMKLIFQSPSGSRQVVKIKTDFNLKDLRNGDKVRIPASKTGQTFDIEGVYKDATSYTDTYTGIESCQQNYTTRECHDVAIPRSCQTVTECNPANPTQCKTREKCTGGGYQNQCRDVTRTHYGQREVSYHYRNNEVNFDMVLLTGSKIVGKISSSKDSNNKVYSYQGVCR